MYLRRTALWESPGRSKASTCPSHPGGRAVRPQAAGPFVSLPRTCTEHRTTDVETIQWLFILDPGFSDPDLNQSIQRVWINFFFMFCILIFILKPPRAVLARTIPRWANYPATQFDSLGGEHVGTRLVHRVPKKVMWRWRQRQSQWDVTCPRDMTKCNISVLIRWHSTMNAEDKPCLHIYMYRKIKLFRILVLVNQANFFQSLLAGTRCWAVVRLCHHIKNIILIKGYA